jgi:hypothetical protein
LSNILKARDYLEELGVDGRIILNWNVTWFRKGYISHISVRTGTGGGML